uniref:Uncharacterized protein n=1 Tax=Acrobeloides nanus TaxID=290746 RepID=A0A914EC58_9BILA
MTNIIFNEARKSRLELLMEIAMRTGDYTNLGENCTALNYNRFRQVRPDVHQKWRDGVDTFDKLRTVNFGLNMFFGILGIFISLVVIRLIHKYADLKTSYGYFCLIQAYTDLILLGNTVIFEGLMSARAMYIGEDDSLEDVDFTAENPSLPWRWDYLMFYIYYSSKFATSIITFLKAFTRVMAKIRGLRSLSADQDNIRDLCEYGFLSADFVIRGSCDSRIMIRGYYPDLCEYGY